MHVACDNHSFACKLISCAAIAVLKIFETLASLSFFVGVRPVEGAPVVGVGMPA